MKKLPARLVAVFMILLAIAPAIFSARRLLVRPKLKNGPETTFISGPLRPDGTVDYLAALNERAGEGVTPENNAVVPIAKLFGPQPIPLTARSRYFAQLGIEPLPEQGDYFVADEDFLKAEGLPVQLDQIYGGGAPWTAENHPLLARRIASVKKQFALLEEAGRRERYFSPMVYSSLFSTNGIGADAVKPYNQELRQITRLLVLRAKFRMEAGHIDGAGDDAFVLLRLGRLVTHDSTVINWLIGSAIFSQGISVLEHLALSGNLSEEQAVALSARLDDLPAAAPIVERIDFDERCAVLDAILFQAGAASRLNPNIMLPRANRLFDRMVEVAQIEGPLERANAADKLESEFDRELNKHRNSWGMYVRLWLDPHSEMSRLMADTLLALTLPSSQQLLNAENRARIKVELARVGLAIGQHRARNGEYPETLADLVPGELAAVPKDPYSDEPYRYQLTPGGFIVYSIGPDEADEFAKLRGSDDIRFGDRRESDE